MLTSLPFKFNTFFWDVDPLKIDLQKHESFIIERILEWGDIDALEWIKESYGKERIISALKNSRNISVKTANFYTHIFNIPRRDLRCFQTRSFLKMPWFSRN